jgi:hypothetical protein
VNGGFNGTEQYDRQTPVNLLMLFRQVITNKTPALDFHSFANTQTILDFPFSPR